MPVTTVCCTEKLTPLLAMLDTVTTTLPLKAPVGTVAVMLVLLHAVVVAVTPPKVTAPLLPNPVPVMVTEFPGKPLVGLRLVIVGALNAAPLLDRPPWLTTTLPMVEIEATATTLLSDQLETVALVPPNITVPVLDPKLLPAMVTEIPDEPWLGVKLMMVGVRTRKATPLVCTPPAVTTTLPLVAPLGTTATMLVLDQLETVADCPLNVTVPVVVPNVVPEIVIEAPGSALAGLKDLRKRAFSVPNV